MRLEYFFRFEDQYFLVIALLLLLGAVLFRYRFFKEVFYRYSLTRVVKSHGTIKKHPYKTILYLIRFSALLLLALLVAKPQLVDPRSNAIIDGLDIVIVLDASGSMQNQDYSDDNRSRFDVAKEEAIRFVKKRANDAIGLIIFGQCALSRCPLTLDKNMVVRLINDLKIGDINPDGTVLATSIVTAINRLKRSTAKSKIMILLTDGEPTPGDIDCNDAIAVAKKMGVKVYTVGIGSDKDENLFHPFYGYIAKPKVNVPLLQHISRETGGKSFLAKNEHDMRSIYDVIDRLETTQHEAPLYDRYFDVFGPFLIVVLFLLLLELILSSFVWFGI